MSAPRRTIIRFLFLLLALLLVASFGSVWFMFRMARHYYAEVLATRLNPLGLKEAGEVVRTRRPVLVYYGDSRAAQWPEPAWLAGETVNLGIGGQTTEQILLRLDRQFEVLHPKVIVVQAGINDLKAIPLFPDDEAEIIATCQRNIRQIVARCREHGAKVVVTTVFPVGNVPLHRRPVWSDRVAPAIEAVNRDIRSLASPDVSVLDATDLLTEPNGRLAPAYSRDFLHLSAAAYEQLNAALRDSLKSTVDPTPSDLPGP